MFRKTVFGPSFRLKRENYTLLQGCKRASKASKAPGLHFTPFALARESFRFCPGEKVDWRLLAPNSLNFFSAKKLHLFHIFACKTLLNYLFSKISFFVITESTQSSPFWDRNWVCKSFSLTTVGCVEELHFWKESEGYCNFSQNVLKKERKSFLPLFTKWMSENPRACIAKSHSFLDNFCSCHNTVGPTHFGI